MFGAGAVASFAAHRELLPACVEAIGSGIVTALDQRGVAIGTNVIPALRGRREKKRIARRDAVRSVNVKPLLPAFSRRAAIPHDSERLQLAALRQQAGLSQKELARRLKTSQQQISRLESPGYAGHSLATLRRVAEALSARLRVVFEPAKTNSTRRIGNS